MNILFHVTNLGRVVNVKLTNSIFVQKPIEQFFFSIRVYRFAKLVLVDVTY